MSEKFTGHGIVGPMGGPGPAAPDQLSGEIMAIAKLFRNCFPLLPVSKSIFVDFETGSAQKRPRF